MLQRSRLIALKRGYQKRSGTPTAVSMSRASISSISAIHLVPHSFHRKETAKVFEGRVCFQRLFFSSEISKKSRIQQDAHRPSNPRREIPPTHEINQLLDEELHPLGSFSPKEWSECRRILVDLADKRKTTPEDVRLSFSLLERMVKEHSVTGVNEKGMWLYKGSMFLNKLVKQWKNVARKRGKEVIDPISLGNWLDGLSKQVPEFKYDKFTFSMIMDVILSQKSPQEAPIVAESLLNFLKEEAHKGRPELKPDHVIWTQVLKAWSNS